MISDTAHWHNREPPLAPNRQEVTLYENLIGARRPVCLLGMTRELARLCDLAVDLAPVDIGRPTLKCNWNDLKGNFGVVIGDGVLNLEGLGLVEKMLALADRFVARVYTKKQPWMKYATFFPTDFPSSKTVTMTQDNIVVAVWERKW
jgi:hypothetical protein